MRGNADRNKNHTGNGALPPPRRGVSRDGRLDQAPAYDLAKVKRRWHPDGNPFRWSFPRGRVNASADRGAGHLVLRELCVMTAPPTLRGDVWAQWMRCRPCRLHAGRALRHGQTLHPAPPPGMHLAVSTMQGTDAVGGMATHECVGGTREPDTAWIPHRNAGTARTSDHRHQSTAVVLLQLHVFYLQLWKLWTAHGRTHTSVVWPATWCHRPCPIPL